MKTKLIPAYNVLPGDTIQHPAKQWPARKVLRIEKLPNYANGSVRFILPAMLGGETGVIMNREQLVLLHKI